MAKEKQPLATRPNSRCRPRAALIPFLLAISNPLSGGAIATANCGTNYVRLTSATTNSAFHFLDAVNITYRSDFANPALSCWCGVSGQTTRKFDINNVNPSNGSLLILLNFSSETPCWFRLTSAAGDCGAISESFLVSPNLRPSSDNQAALIGASTSTPTTFRPPRRLSRATIIPPLAPRSPVGENPQVIRPRSENFSTAARAALGVGIALICIAIGAMAGFFYFKWRRRGQDDSMGRRDCRAGKPEPGKYCGASSVASGQSDEPLHPIQPVYDGFPGSTGYDDVRPLQSTLPSHSPAPTHSPSHNGGFWTNERSTEREELAAARLKSQLRPSAPAVVSYGPNPVTPTIRHHNNARREDEASADAVSPDSTKSMPLSSVPLMGYSDYAAYDMTPVSKPKQSPLKQKPVLVVSYGPNKVTPTPLIVSPTVPPDESVINRRFQEASSAVSHERQFSWEPDSPLLGAAMGPLPPYASTEEFEAMEKGAVRKLAEPQAEAELPPTKDGFYHYTSDVVEHELPGAAPQNEPQLPFRPYKVHLQQAGGSSAAGAGGVIGGRNIREIDEQKFLLDDAEIVKLREEKAKARAAAAARQPVVKEEEEYDLGEPLYMDRDSR
ncbi:hypothetical protein VTK26DRAFT_7217 [Humicola hyalothermophila]